MASEGIDGVRRHGGANVGFECIATDDIHRSFKESRDIFFQSNIVKESDMGLRLDIDDDIEVTVRSIISACNRPEHAGVTNTPRAQVRLVATKSGKRILSVHDFLIARA